MLALFAIGPMGTFERQVPMSANSKSLIDLLIPYFANLEDAECSILARVLLLDVVKQRRSMTVPWDHLDKYDIDHREARALMQKLQDDGAISAVETKAGFVVSAPTSGGQS